MRGQAFEVFRLLIAAVVAGAILMVLLGLLQNLITPTTDPQTAAAQLVKKYATYGGTGATDYIQFRKGMAIDAAAIAREAYLDPSCVGVSADNDVGGFNCTDGRCIYTNDIGTRAIIFVECGDNVTLSNSGTTTGGAGTGSCSIKCQITVKKNLS